jgi:hypothetical protein
MADWPLHCRQQFHVKRVVQNVVFISILWPLRFAAQTFLEYHQRQRSLGYEAHRKTSQLASAAAAAAARRMVVRVERKPLGIPAGRLSIFRHYVCH